jgi:hypothetical protein
MLETTIAATLLIAWMLGVYLWLALSRSEITNLMERPEKG